MRMRHCHLWKAPLCNVFSTLTHKLHIFEKQLLNKNACFDFLYNFCLKHFSF